MVVSPFPYVLLLALLMRDGVEGLALSLHDRGPLSFRT